MNFIFGSGYAVFGTHPEIKVEGMKFSEEVKTIWQTGVKVTTQYANQVSVSHNFVERLLKAERLSVEPPSKCSDCRG